MNKKYISVFLLIATVAVAFASTRDFEIFKNFLKIYFPYIFFMILLRVRVWRYLAKLSVIFVLIAITVEFFIHIRDLTGDVYVTLFSERTFYGYFLILAYLYFAGMSEKYRYRFYAPFTYVLMLPAISASVYLIAIFALPRWIGWTLLILIGIILILLYNNFGVDIIAHRPLRFDAFQIEFYRERYFLEWIFGTYDETNDELIFPNLFSVRGVPSTGTDSFNIFFFFLNNFGVIGLIQLLIVILKYRKRKLTWVFLLMSQFHPAFAVTSIYCLFLHILNAQARK